MLNLFSIMMLVGSVVAVHSSMGDDTGPLYMLTGNVPIRLKLKNRNDTDKVEKNGITYKFKLGQAPDIEAKNVYLNVQIWNAEGLLQELSINTTDLGKLEGFHSKFHDSKSGEWIGLTVENSSFDN